MVNIDIKKEYTKCVKDPKYVIENYFKIVHSGGGDYSPIKLLANQSKLIDAYESNQLNLIKKYRQAGVSKLNELYLSCKAAFSDQDKPELIIIVSNSLDLSKHMLKSMKQFLLSLPRWIWGSDYYGSEENEKKTIFLKDSLVEVELPNGSRIRVVSSHISSFRGWTPTYTLMDEAAFINNNDELFVGVTSSLAVGGRAIIASTPNGVDRLFNVLYMGAMCGENTFNVIDLHWWDDERFNMDLKWVLKRGDEVIHQVENVKPENHSKMILSGYKPTNGWYEHMFKLLYGDDRQIRQEINAEFVV